MPWLVLRSSWSRAVARCRCRPPVRHRWGLDNEGRVTVIDLGDAVVLLPPGARQRLLADALSAEAHRSYVENLDDSDLATT